MTMPDPPGRQVIAPGEPVASDWGNAVWSQSVQRFANLAQLADEWPDPDDGALAYLAVPGGWIERRGGQWENVAGPIGFGGVFVAPPGGVVLGTTPRLEGGSNVVTTNAAGGFGTNFAAPGAGIVMLMLNAAEDINGQTNLQAMSPSGFSGLYWFRDSGNVAVSAAVRVNYFAILL